MPSFSRGFTLPARRSFSVGESSSKGFTLIEVLAAAFIVATVTVAVTGLATVSLRTAVRSEQEVVLQGLVNAETENIRRLSYNQVSFQEQGGVIPVTKEIKRNKQTYTLNFYIKEIDDPADGPTPEGSIDIDYKNVQVEGQAPGVGGSSNNVVVSTTTIVVPDQRASCLPGSLDCDNPYPDCQPGAPESCPDTNGDGVLDACPVDTLGICPGSRRIQCTPGAAGTCPFNLSCPASGSCSARCGDPGTPNVCPGGAACPASGYCEGPGSEPTSPKTLCPANGFCPTPCDPGLDCDQPPSGSPPEQPPSECENTNPDSTAACTPPREIRSPCLACGGFRSVVTIGAVQTIPECTEDSFACGVVGFRFESCANDPICQGEGPIDTPPDQCVKEDPCITRFGCPRNSTCSRPFPGSTTECTKGACCPDSDPVCLSQSDQCSSPSNPAIVSCMECTAANKDNCGKLEPSICGYGDNKNKYGKECGCFFSQCAECTRYGQKDDGSERQPAHCSPEKPYCGSGGSVRVPGIFPGPDQPLDNVGSGSRLVCKECLEDRHCRLKINDPDIQPPLDSRKDRCWPSVGECVECITDDDCRSDYGEFVDTDGDGKPDTVVFKDGKQFCNNIKGLCVDECDNRIDDDGDGLIDRADPSCGISERGPCNNGQDDDGDGRIDFPMDRGCNDVNDPDESGEPQCDDGNDNDRDGLIDMADPDCKDPSDDSEAGSQGLPIATPPPLPAPPQGPP